MGINIQKTMCDFFSSACYAYCLAYIFGDCEKTIKELTKCVLYGWINCYIDDEYYVREPVKYVNGICKYKYRDVRKIPIDDLNDLPEDGLYAVEFVYGEKHHFVVCVRGKVVFDPWGKSETVAKGKPVSYRLFL
jgi:hypothetical protein